MCPSNQVRSILRLMHHSAESNIGALMGLRNLKEKIEQEKYEVLQDSACQLQWQSDLRGVPLADWVVC